MDIQNPQGYAAVHMYVHQSYEAFRTKVDNVHFVIQPNLRRIPFSRQ